MNELDFARNEIAKLCDDIHELTSERDALRAELSKQQALTEASQRVAEVAQYRADTLRARVDEMEKQEPVAWGAFHFGGSLDGRLGAHCETQDQIKKYIAFRHQYDDSNTFRHAPLYTLPGAQHALGVPDGWLERGLAELENIRNRLDDSTLMNDKTLIERLFIAMTTTPEAKE